jgi:hypothetical protein
VAGSDECPLKKALYNNSKDVSNNVINYSFKSIKAAGAGIANNLCNREVFAAIDK